MTFINHGHLPVTVQLNCEKFVVKRQSSQSLPIEPGRLKLFAFIHGTAYAYGIPEYWQKTSNSISTTVRKDLSYQCVCTVGVKKILFGIFKHITAINLSLRETPIKQK